MMTTALAHTNGNATANAALVERVALDGDLAQMTPVDRVRYYGAVCESLGLNPLTKPFDFLKLNGKLVMYARKDCTDQLRKLHAVSITITSREKVGDCYAVTARGSLPDGRTDEAIGAVPIGKASGDELANALMKAETKAKRRVTLSIVGLGMLDETETQTIRGAVRADVDMATGEVVSQQHGGFDGDDVPYVSDRDAESLERDDDSIADMATFNWRAVPITFGKHKGRTLGDVPDEYIEWLEKNWEPKPRQDGSLWPDAVELSRGIAAWSAEYERSMGRKPEPTNDDLPF